MICYYVLYLDFTYHLQVLIGVWGTGILENDDSCDIHDYYMDLYNNGVDTKLIRKKIEKEFKYFGANPILIDNSNFWIGLAQAQWECKALDQDILKNVETIVTEKIDLNLWENDEDRKKREQSLKRFLTKIRKEKKTAKRRVKPKLFKAPFKKGDCITFKYPSGYFGGAICLGSSKELKKNAFNIIAVTRIHQKNKPQIDDFLKSHILIINRQAFDNKEDRFTDKYPGYTKNPRPCIYSYIYHEDTVPFFLDKLQCIGYIDIKKEFGDICYGSISTWNLTRESNLQLRWEENDPKSINLSLPLEEFIDKPEDSDLAILGEYFAFSQSENYEWKK